MQSPYLPVWLDRLHQHRSEKILIVPGGGVFADHIRQLQQHWRFDDDTAHKLALRAMEQYGLVLQALAPTLKIVRSVADIKQAMAANWAAIWFPYDMVANNAEIKASWDVTSDSLALWLADTLQSENLLMVKSIGPDNQNYSARSLSSKGYLDKAFAEMLEESPVKVRWIRSDQVDRVDDLFSGEVYLAEVYPITAR